MTVTMVAWRVTLWPTCGAHFENFQKAIPQVAVRAPQKIHPRSRFWLPQFCHLMGLQRARGITAQQERTIAKYPIFAQSYRCCR